MVIHGGRRWRMDASTYTTRSQSKPFTLFTSKSAMGRGHSHSVRTKIASYRKWNRLTNLMVTTGGAWRSTTWTRIYTAERTTTNEQKSAQEGDPGDASCNRISFVLPLRSEDCNVFMDGYYLRGVGSQVVVRFLLSCVRNQSMRK